VLFYEAEATDNILYICLLFVQLYYHFIVAIAFCQLLANSQRNAVDIKLGLLNINFMPTRAK